MIFEIPKDTEVLQIDITEVKKQIKADLIREVEKKVRVEVIEEYTNKLLDLIHQIPSRCIGGANVKEIAEQLKEQNK